MLPNRNANAEAAQIMARSPENSFEPPVWRDPDGEPLTCRDKIEVLNENLEEIREMCQDALEDAILMGADEAQARETLEALVHSLVNPYGNKKKKEET